MIGPYSDEYFMKQAYAEALKAKEQDEVPVGAVIVSNNTVIARAHNFTEHLCDVTAHAEMQAITAAAEYLGGKYLSGCTLYVTLEPCVMCAGALYWSQLDKIVFAARDEKRGAGRYGKELYHPKTEITSGIMEQECAELIVHFFKEKTQMRIAEIIMSWVFSVVLGSLICGLFSEIAISIIFAIFSGVLSLPYLVLMILLGRKRLPFLALEAIHLGLALVTGVVIVLFENNFFRFFYVLFLYFFLGLIAHAYFYYRSPLREKKERDDLLDF